MCLRISYKKKHFFETLKSLKKGVKSRVGSGSGTIRQTYRSADLDPSQNVRDPQYDENSLRNV
jgi:hypothetical protein